MSNLSKQFCIVVFLLLFSSTLLIAQTQRTCGTNALLQELINKDPQVAQKFQQMRQDARSFQSNKRSARASIVIPVVVHVHHNASDANPGQGSNISDAQILSQIAVLNEDFNAQNADLSDVPSVFQNLIGDLDVEFRMAEFDEQGNATNGITRHSLAGTTWSDNLKPSSIWDPNQYLNIWVTSIQGGTLGYATFPGTSPNGDGVVVDYHFFGRAPDNPFNSDFDLGRTATHEVGHWLGLEHTFQGNSCGGNTIATCTFAGDGICDTPPLTNANYGCNFSVNQDNCTETPNNLPDMWMNYMDYSDDACLLMFTEEQADVMLGVLNTSRSSIKTSNGVSDGPTYTLSGTVIDAATNAPVPNAKILLNSAGARYEITCNNDGQFTASSGRFKAGEYEVYAGKWGYMTSLHDTAFNLQNNTNGLQIPINPGVYYDDFILDFGWTSSGTAISGLWERGIPVGTSFENELSNPNVDVEGDFGADCYVTGNGGGQAGNDDVDDGNVVLTSPIFDLSGYERPFLSYYRWFFNDGGQGNLNDELTISISNGNTSKVIEILNVNSPNSNSWRYYELNVPDLILPTANMQITIETADQSASGHLVEAGFDLFMVVDSANISTALAEISNQDKSIILYPNPNNGQFIIEWENQTPEQAAVKIYSLSGQMVWHKYFGQLQQSKIEVQTQSLNSGLYLIEVFDGEKITTKKLSIY